jgi:phosphate transport system ATP-binding protein
MPMSKNTKIKVENINFFYGKNQALKSVNMEICANQVTALIGPSGCGKSTFIRLFNRMNDLVPKTRVEGKIFLDEENILSQKVDVLRA